MLKKSRLEKVFNMFDKVPPPFPLISKLLQDGSGQIDAQEIKAVFKTNAENNEVSDKLWDDLIKEADVDNDGQIDLHEFINFM
jgi:Ca2+-binding EF-hand superfamily protein